VSVDVDEVLDRSSGVEVAEDEGFFDVRFRESQSLDLRNHRIRPPRDRAEPRSVFLVLPMLFGATNAADRRKRRTE
jgi:hypothetical protein